MRREPAAEALDAGEAHAVQLPGGAVEQVDAAVAQQRGELGRAAALVVVVAEHRHHGEAEPPERAQQLLALLEQAEVGEIAADEQHVRRILHALEDAAHLRASGDAAMQVRDRGDPHSGLPERSRMGGWAPASR